MRAHKQKRINRKIKDNLVSIRFEVSKMNNEYTVIVVACEEKDNAEVKEIIDTFLKSTKAKNGQARVVYHGSEAKYIAALENILKLAK